MKLSIAMIAEAFREYKINCFFHKYDRTLLIERYKFYNGDLTLHADTLYIFTTKKFEMLPLELVSIEEGTSIIFLDNQEELTRLQKTAYICIDQEEISLENLVNKLSDVFEKYRRIDYAMKNTIHSNESMQKLVEIATVLFDNEITIRNSEYRFIAHSYKNLRYIGKNNQPDDEGYVSVEEIQDLKTSPDYLEKLCTQNVWNYRFRDHEMLCFDIFIQDIFIYRVKLINVNHEFRPYDSALFLYFTQIVKEKYSYMKDSSSSDISSVQKTLQALLNSDEYVEEQDMQLFLRKLNFKVNDQYLIVCMQSGKNTGSINAYLYYSMMLNKLIDSIYSFIYENKLVALIKVGTDSSQEEILKKLTKFLRDENFRAGISFEFQDLYKASIYYKQASLALQLGTTYTPFIWIYFFKDYRYQYLYQLISNIFSSGKYIVPELHELSEWDKNNNTEYAKTLQCYIKNNQNVTRTAKEISIHRSTLLYRLEKISSIMHINIDDTDAFNLFSLFLKFVEFNQDYL